ncbi:hypothetical protein TanjilG_14547 [Lupinus angustifolius]|uniref:Transcription repressor n=1 Tax=Lupinus angustifolius TaxID=3871 RepID=A0A394DFI1_LUPAN|nr:PREDICTED: transcription repressor OFP1-like [Lupinus angustifolius]OIW21902.1 hypothetical protein TanjilG_14547 [Lupinus angustifolius]
MGNNKFKLSNMMPNAWFYKLRDMNRSRKQNGSSHHVMNSKVTSPSTSQMSQPRYSHYFSIEPKKVGKLCNSPIYTKYSNITFIDSPRRSSSKRRAIRKTIHSKNNWTKPNHIQSPNYYVSSIKISSESNRNEYDSSESDCDKFSAPNLVNRLSSSTDDIIIDMSNGESFTGNSENLDEFHTISQIELAPILTKPVRFDDKVIEATKLRSSAKLDELHAYQSIARKSRTQREQKTSSIARKSSASSTGIRLRVNSPKLARRSVSSSACKASKNTGFPEGFAVFKSSLDPQRDFRDSMSEMIKENKIRASKDLENLLACYLSLNSREYHDLIIKAFEQIWYGMAQLKL